MRGASGVITPRTRQPTHRQRDLQASACASRKSIVRMQSLACRTHLAVGRTILKCGVRHIPRPSSILDAPTWQLVGWKYNNPLWRILAAIHFAAYLRESKTIPEGPAVRPKNSGT